MGAGWGGARAAAGIPVTQGLILDLALAAALLLVLPAPVFVLGTSLVASLLGRGIPPDPDRGAAFAPGAVPIRRRLLWLPVEMLWQAVTWALQLAHGLRPFRCAPLTSGGGMPVLLLAGYLENAGVMWPLARRLAARGYQPVLCDLPSTLRSLRASAVFVRRTVASVHRAGGDRPIAIVGHSMGGVLARMCVLSGRRDRVAVVISIASPHRGTRMASLGCGRSSRDLRPESALLSSLSADRQSEVPVHSLVSTCDNLVIPPWSATLAEGDDRVLAVPVGHTSPLFLRSAAEQVGDWLDEVRATPPARAPRR